jgi:uncharacterized protein with NRDE domain
MCLIAVAVDAHPRWRFVLAGNRDEFHARPTAAAGFLDPEEATYGGRDLQAGGGWLQVARDGRVAAVTNVRLGRAESSPRSRGALVADFVAGTATASAYLEALQPHVSAFGRFNLLLWDGTAHYASNHPAHRARVLVPGVHAVSNADLDTPWPKTEALRGAMARWLSTADRRTPREGGDLLEPLFAALADPREAPDAALPDTGVGLEWERRLSASFIRGEAYGTRASTVVLVGDDGLWFEERSFGPGGTAAVRRGRWLARR